MKLNINIFITCTAIVSILLFIGCSNASKNTAGSPELTTGPSETSGENISDYPSHQGADYSTLAEEPYNPDGIEEMRCKLSLLNSLIQNAGVRNWFLLVEGSLPDTYESLLENGALTIIPANRYTGEDILSTKEYSPGDIYYHSATGEEPFHNYWVYFGEQDFNYEPSISESGERFRIDGRALEYSTDGKTGYTDAILPAEFRSYVPESTSSSREVYNVPADDEARVRMLLLSYTMHDIMRSVAQWIEGNLPVTVDGFIELVGRKNPVAWTNPYTGDPMYSVSWIDVPQFQGNWDFNEPNTDFGTTDSTSGLVGNYSFAMGPDRYYAQFYFEMPDGSIGAYIAFCSLD